MTEDLRLKRKKKILGLGLLFFAISGGVAYPVYKIWWARQQVRGFCAQVSVNGPVQDLEAQAKRMGLRVLSRPASKGEPAMILVWEGFAFARQFCEIQHANGVVLKKETTSLD